MKRAAKVEVGQKFQAIGTVTGTPTYTYQVQALFRSRVDQVAYVRLVQVGDPTQTKSIAVTTLVNPRHFIPLAAPAEKRPEVA
jgi:hypothetical protein